MKKMKKVTYLLALVFALSLMSFSCSKDEDDPNPPAVSPYVGNWINDSTTIDGVITTTVREFQFNITETTATITTVNSSDDVNWNYTSWSASNNQLVFTDATGTHSKQTFNIVSAPVNDLMVVSKQFNDGTYKYFLHKD